MKQTTYFYKELTAAEVGNTKTHEIYIRFPNNFDYKSFFNNSDYANGNVIQVDIKAIDKTFGKNYGKTVPLRFVFFHQSNQEKRIPSLGPLFDIHNVNEGDIVCLESIVEEATFSYTICFYKKGTISISPSSIYFTKAEANNPRKDVSIDLPSRQIIYYGAPGTGKSYKIQEITETTDNFTRTTFHPDSDYSTFVGCYKPSMESKEEYYERLCDINYLAQLLKSEYYESDKKTVVVDSFAVKYAEYLDGIYGKVSLNDLCEKAEIPTGYATKIRDDINLYHSYVKNVAKPSKIAYSFVPQAFLQAYVKAWKNQEEPYYLVIEEINRGNCAQIFGDLFQLLDRDKSGKSTYGITPDKDIANYLKKEFEHTDNLPEKIKSATMMMLPSNLYILCSMNTSDQSLFPIDSAFKRRWDWEYVPIEDAGKKHYIKIGNLNYDWWNFIETINEKIDALTGSEDKKMGYWFVKPQNDDKVITAKQFVSKVMFYLWNDIFKDYYGNNQCIFKVKNADGTIEKKPFTYFFGSDAENRIKAFMAYNKIEPVTVDDIEDDNDDDDAVSNQENNLQDSATQTKRRALWTEFNQIMKSMGRTEAQREASVKSNYDIRFKTSGFNIKNTVHTTSFPNNPTSVYSEIYIRPVAKWIYDSIEPRLDELQNMFDEEFEWREVNGSHVGKIEHQVNFDDESNKEAGMKWLAETSAKLYDFLKPIVDDNK